MPTLRSSVRPSTRNTLPCILQLAAHQSQVVVSERFCRSLRTCTPVRLSSDDIFQKTFSDTLSGSNSPQQKFPVQSIIALCSDAGLDNADECAWAKGVRMEGTRFGNPGVRLISFFSQCTSTSLSPRCNFAGNNSSSFLFNIGSCEYAYLASYVKSNDFVLATIRSCPVLKEINLASNIR